MDRIESVYLCEVDGTRVNLSSDVARITWQQIDGDPLSNAAWDALHQLETRYPKARTVPPWRRAHICLKGRIGAIRPLIEVVIFPDTGDLFVGFAATVVQGDTTEIYAIEAGGMFARYAHDY